MKKIFENLGIGTDIVEIDRFKGKNIKKNKSFYDKIFYKSEIDYCLKFRYPYTHFAGKFALKESVIKSIPDKISFLDVKSSNSKYGPTVTLVGKYSKKYSFLASISHEQKYAMATVISLKL